MAGMDLDAFISVRSDTSSPHYFWVCGDLYRIDLEDGCRIPI